MRHILSQAIGFFIAAFLGAFAVILAGCVLKGDDYALMLLITEVVLLIFPEFFSEGKLQKNLSKYWNHALIFWMIAMFWWVLYRMQLV